MLLRTGPRLPSTAYCSCQTRFLQDALCSSSVTLVTNAQAMQLALLLITFSYAGHSGLDAIMSN